MITATNETLEQRNIQNQYLQCTAGKTIRAADRSSQQLQKMNSNGSDQQRKVASSRETRRKKIGSEFRDVKSAIGRNDGDQFMQILSLSYNSLPHHLRACFLHMGLFPEDYEIFVSHLIKLWIAEGFIKPLPVESLEQLAKDYLSDLINRSLIEVRRRKHNGEI
ncbi:Disease resistance protein RPP13 [Sesamum angolense]|uniref:Disease resistance protein RPP13 n=1 Tax=Sesamum angolense TaxID=2727404 RepID=A0AAE1VYB4_9LAMI|nr:Disease resistance protein RPP13 [Sesamum angolense]